MDGLPAVGARFRARHLRVAPPADAYFAFGHGHLGLTYGAVTGRLIADLAAGRDPGLDMRPYRVDRW